MKVPAGNRRFTHSHASTRRVATRPLHTVTEVQILTVSATLQYHAVLEAGRS